MASRREVRGLAVYDHPGNGARARQLPQVVLVHGAMDRGAGMLKVARRLRDVDVVRYDRRGYGRSRPTGMASSFRDHVDDLSAVMGDRPSVLVGHSYGGVVSMALASTGDERLVGVVTYEAPRAWETWWSKPPDKRLDPAEAAESFLRRMIGDELWEALPAQARADRRAEGAAMVAEMNWQVVQRYDATLIEVPLVVGYGSASSPRAHRAAQVTMQEATFGQLVEIAGAGHGAHGSHPDEFAELARRTGALS